MIITSNATTMSNDKTTTQKDKVWHNAVTHANATEGIHHTTKADTTYKHAVHNFTSHARKKNSLDVMYIYLLIT